MYDYDAYSEPGEGDAFKAGTWPFGLSGQPRDIPVPKGAVCAQISNILGDNKNDDSNEFTARKYQKQDEDGEEDYDDDDEEERGAEEERIVTKTTPRASSLSSVAGEYSIGGQADTLPVAPGLFVDRVGCIALPLCDEQAEKLIAKCDKSPFGRKLDTMTDENVRKSWQLAPDQVAINNPLWHTGIEKLSETVASRLGYKGVPIQCKLYKMLVYGEGGHFVKHQDTEKEDGMVATLVVQLPSLHEGRKQCSS
ncbi:hypothetical protein F441_17769 [Phytophthora nicotianae CJ01A1]|uniref:Prolyl 4-hydroxylase alpha subunit Fe(2+) 2OG dioxygenase domain-containing protein n=3 Tax=Phytophthora nicotianae TaxID=4792 RepID=V9E9S0_PHYNI|nr:hypothetical protein F443_17897 [Phytophthora nicotianae P1569]ETP05670.1 hypothetical protein F441_17769 [Phytophthora nicotianae CJ01A1]